MSETERECVQERVRERGEVPDTDIAGVELVEREERREREK